MNIEEYEFSDGLICLDSEDHYAGFIHEGYFELDRDDVIALAKHFKLTADDIKE